MSKKKSKPKRIEYVTAASYEILSDERDALEGALTDVEQERDALRAERNSLAMVLDATRESLEKTERVLKSTAEDRDSWIREFNMWRSAWVREMGGVIRSKAHEIDGFVLRTRDIFERSKRTESAEENYRTMCEYRDQWATQSAVWEEKVKELENLLISEQDTCEIFISESLDRKIMLDVVCRALEIAQDGVSWWQAERAVQQLLYNIKCDELELANRNVFSKLWHWFTHLGEITERNT